MNVCVAKVFAKKIIIDTSVVIVGVSLGISGLVISGLIIMSMAGWIGSFGINPAPIALIAGFALVLCIIGFDIYKGIRNIHRRSVEECDESARVR